VTGISVAVIVKLFIGYFGRKLRAIDAVGSAKSNNIPRGPLNSIR